MLFWFQCCRPWDESPANLTQIRWKNVVHGGGVVWGRLEIQMGFREVGWQREQTKPGAGTGLEGGWEEAGRAFRRLVSYLPREGWEGPGFLSAAARAKSPVWEGWEGQVSYPPRIGQNRLSAADRAKSPLREGWGGPGFVSAARG